MSAISQFILHQEFCLYVGEIMSACILVDIAQDDALRARRREALKRTLELAETFRTRYHPPELEGLSFEKLRTQALKRLGQARDSGPLPQAT